MRNVFGECALTGDYHDGRARVKEIMMRPMLTEKQERKCSCMRDEGAVMFGNSFVCTAESQQLQW